MSKEAMKVEGPLHVVCQCDKCKAEKQDTNQPVAWMQEGQPELYVKEEKDEKRRYVIPLYATPQPKQEQANFCGRCGKRLGKNDWDIHTCTPPQQRKPLTDEIPKSVLLAISNAGMTLLKRQHGYELRKLGLFKAIEAKLKEKNGNTK